MGERMLGSVLPGGLPALGSMALARLESFGLHNLGIRFVAVDAPPAEHALGKSALHDFKSLGRVIAQRHAGRCLRLVILYGPRWLRHARTDEPALVRDGFGTGQDRNARPGHVHGLL